jgi:hypothetical protein
MRKYTDVEERRVRAHARVREWGRSGLLSAAQADGLEGDFAVDLRRTNIYLRATLAFFTLLIVVGLVGVPASALNLSREMPLAVLTAVAAIICITASEVLAGPFRLYRFGVEEMLAACSVALLSFSASQFVRAVLLYYFPATALVHYSAAPFIVGLCVAAAGGLGLYLRFGFVWAALGGMCCLAAIPFQISDSPATGRAAAAVLVAAVFAITRVQRTRHGDEWPGDEYGVLQAAALCGVYFVLNVRVLSWSDYRFLFLFEDQSVYGWFYWLTWVLTWILPAVGLVLGIRDKDRPLLIVSVAMAIVTLTTNKPYLGWERHTWDPMLLGVALIAVALGVRRWLSGGRDAARHGFTATSIVVGNDPVLSVLSAAPFPMKAHAHTPAPPAPSGFDAGRSGGAGGGGSF